jgi:hypothetical protein
VVNTLLLLLLLLGVVLLLLLLLLLLLGVVLQDAQAHESPHAHRAVVAATHTVPHAAVNTPNRQVRWQ